MHKIKTFLRYLKDFIQYRQLRLVISSIIYLLTKKSFASTKIFRGKLGYFLHRKGSIDFQFGNYAYEWNVKQFILKHYKDYNVFLDVGANIGTYAIMMAGMGLRSYAFEPSLDNYRALRINILLNKLEKSVTTFNFGLDNKNRKAEFVFDPVNTGASHMRDVAAHDPVTDGREVADEVQLFMLDHVIDQLALKESDRIFMKIDVEGMEDEVIDGAKKFIQTFPNILIVMESVHSGEEKLKSDLSKIARFEFYPVDHLNFAAKKIGNL